MLREYTLVSVKACALEIMSAASLRRDSSAKLDDSLGSLMGHPGEEQGVKYTRRGSNDRR